MYTVRVSKSDPSAFSFLRTVVQDPRRAGMDLYLHVDPGHCVESDFAPVTSKVIVVPTRGPNTVEVTVAQDSNVFNVRLDEELELYGVTIRQGGGSTRRCTCTRGARLKAVDCVFRSSVPLNLVCDPRESANCRFEGGGVHRCDGGGDLRESEFWNAHLKPVRGASLMVDPCDSPVGGTENTRFWSPIRFPPSSTARFGTAMTRQARRIEAGAMDGAIPDVIELRTPSPEDVDGF